MKTNSRYSILLAGVHTAAILTLASLSQTTGFGQEPQLADDDPFAAVPVTTFDFNFAGGSLEEFAQQVMSLHEDLSITVPTDSREAKVPKLNLKKISFEDLANLIFTATQSSDNLIRFENVSQGNWVAIAQMQKEPRELAIFPLETLLRKTSVDDIIAVVEQAFSVAGMGEVPKFHLHKETSVLMASLTQPELEIVERLIETLQVPVPDGAKERQEKREIVEREIDEQRRRFQQLSLELAKMEAKARETNGEDLVMLNAEVQMLKAELRLLESDLTSYMQLLTRLRAAELGVGDDIEIQSESSLKTTPVQR